MTVLTGTRTNPVLRYDRKTIILHWLTAILVVLQWAIAQVIDDWKGAMRVDVRSLHITLGVVLAVVLAVRLLWRRGGGLTLPPAETGLMQLGARAVHLALYGLLVLTVLAGLWLEYLRGDSIFNLFHLTLRDPAMKGLREFVSDWHGNFANLILIVAGLHAGAALAHHYIRRDHVLRRMLLG
jgi:cytochrome b561